MRWVYWFLTLWSVSPAFALDPHRVLTQYSRTLWREQDGLPPGTIRAIAQTADGYLWLGTDEGLARFDGYEFVRFNSDQEGLPSNSVTSLAAGQDGSLWIGTASGLTQYRDGQLHTYTRKNGLLDDSVRSLFMDHAGTLWVVAGSGLSRWDGSEFKNFLPEQDIPLKSVGGLAEDRQNHLYVAGDSGVTRLQDGKFVTLIDSSVISNVKLFVGIRADRNGNVWFLGGFGLLQRSPDGRIRKFGPAEGLPDSVGRGSLLEDHDGNIWVGTAHGIARFEQGAFRTRAGAQGDDSVRCMFEDREGNIWIGTTEGLSRFKDDSFTVFGKSEGLPSDEPNAVYEDRQGRIWVGFVDGGMMLFSGKGRVPATPTGKVFAVRETRSGEVLVSAGYGLLRLSGDQARVFVPPGDPLGRKIVLDALEDLQGRIWLALPRGLGVLEGDRLHLVSEGAPQGGGFVTLTLATDGSIWAGSSRGLWRFSGSQIRQYTRKDGMSSDTVRSLYQERNGTLWIGTFGGGLNVLRDGKLGHISARDGLLSDNIAGIIDDEESLWLSTTNGICRISKKQLWDFMEHRIPSVQPLNYGVADGLRSAQCAPNAPNGGAGGGLHSDGSLWFVTSRGIAVFDPHRPQQAILPPQLHLVEMIADGRPFSAEPMPRVPPGSGRVQLRYAAIHLSAPERVGYSYRMDGLDSTWTSAGVRRGVTYTGLGPGNYRFHVRAELPGGPSSEAIYSFELLPHFYETGWFRALGVLMLASFVWMGYQFRVQQIRSRFALVLKERMRLAREIHDTLAQGFVGIRSQLDALETCIPEVEARSARVYLDVARRMAQHSLTEARRSVMDLRTSALDGQSLPDALAAGARLWTSGSDVDLQVEVTNEIGPVPEEIAHHVLRIAQEAIANALQHASASQIILSLTRARNLLKLNVRDNGCGFDRDDAFVSMGGHFGLIGMRERAERIGGELRLHSGPGQGTQVEVAVPLA